MKTCSSCSLEKADDLFPWRNKAEGIRQHNCKECYRVIRKRNYQKHKQKSIADVMVRKRGIRDWVTAFKSNLKCTTCPENDPCAIDFHHLDPSGKDFSIADAWNRGLSIPRIESELEKCVPVCKNCHAKIHHYGLSNVYAGMVFNGSTEPFQG